VADVPSESHSYCVESSGSDPDVRPDPTDPVENILDVVEDDVVRIRNNGRFRPPVTWDAGDFVPDSAPYRLRPIDECNPFLRFLRGGTVLWSGDDDDDDAAAAGAG